MLCLISLCPGHHVALSLYLLSLVCTVIASASSSLRVVSFSMYSYASLFCRTIFYSRVV